MKLNSKIKPFLKVTWQRGLFVAALLCAFAVVEFSAELPKKMLPTVMRINVPNQSAKSLAPPPHSLEALKQEVEAAKKATEEAIEKDVSSGRISENEDDVDLESTLATPSLAELPREDLAQDKLSFSSPPTHKKAISVSQRFSPKKQPKPLLLASRSLEQRLLESVPLLSRLERGASQGKQDSEKLTDLELWTDEPQWEESEAEKEAVDVTSPLEQLAKATFDEPPLSAATQSDRLFSEAQEGDASLSQPTITLEKRIQASVAYYQKNDFAELHQDLSLFGKVAASLKNAAPAPKALSPRVEKEPELVRSSPQKIVARSKPVAKFEKEKEPALVGSLKEPDSFPEDRSEEERADETREVRNTPPEEAPSPPAPVSNGVLSPDDASFGDFHLGKEDYSVSQARKELDTQTPAPQLVTPPTKVLTQNGKKWIVSSQSSQGENGAEKEEDLSATSQEGSRVFGRIELDSGMEQWLESTKGHIELSLRPESSRDPQDNIFLDYEYPSENFEIDGRMLSGQYRLVAGVYVPHSTTPVAEIAYARPITSGNMHRFIPFGIKHQAFQAQRSLQPRPSSPSNVIVAATVFEAITGDLKKPRPIRNATVSIVGHPEYGTFKTDKEGNVRIDKTPLPHYSELPLEVKADGFYRTKIIVPTSSESLSYRPVYLVGLETVKNITKFFLKNEQRSGLGLIVGRLFDDRRKPQKDVEVTMSARKGHAVPLDWFPRLDRKKTTDTGNFFIPNILPSFRAVQRSTEAPSMLVDVMPDTATYLELGRGGKKDLHLKIKRASSEPLPPTLVRLVGDPSSDTQVSADGTAVIKNIDFPPGVLSIEIQSKGLPLTLHTLPWNIRERGLEHELYLMDGQVIKESIAEVARKKVPNGAGVLLGQINSYLFKDGDECLHVRFKDMEGRLLSEENGPFPFAPVAKTNAKPGCFYKHSAGFTAILSSGEYLTEFTDEEGHLLAEHVQRVGMGRVSILFPNAKGKI